MAVFLKFGSALSRQIVNKRAFLSLQSSVRMTSYLIDNPKYSWLKELGLEKQNKGVYYGEWAGNGAVRILSERGFSEVFIFLVMWQYVLNASACVQLLYESICKL